MGAALHSPPEGTHPDQTDGDTSPSEPISASTEKELATEATEVKGRASPKAEQAFKPVEVHGSRVDDSSSPSSSPALRQTISPESPDRSSSEIASSRTGRPTSTRSTPAS